MSIFRHFLSLSIGEVCHKMPSNFIHLCYKTSYISMEVNCTEPSPFVSVAWIVPAIEAVVSSCFCDLNLLCVQFFFNCHSYKL